MLRRRGRRRGARPATQPLRRRGAPPRRGARRVPSQPARSMESSRARDRARRLRRRDDLRGDLARAAGRSPTSVAARARRLGISDYARRWTAADDALLVRLTRARTPPLKADRVLVRTPEAVRRRCRQLGLPAPPPAAAARSRKPWTPSEDAVLRLHAGLNPATLAEWLGRSDHAVSCRTRALELRDERRRSPHHPVGRVHGVTPVQQSAIRRAADTLKPTRVVALARRLDLPPAMVREIAALASPDRIPPDSGSRVAQSPDLLSAPATVRRVRSDREARLAQGPVERPALRSEPLGEDVDRPFVECERDDDEALVLGEAVGQHLAYTTEAFDASASMSPSRIAPSRWAHRRCPAGATGPAMHARGTEPPPRKARTWPPKCRSRSIAASASLSLRWRAGRKERGRCRRSRTPGAEARIERREGAARACRGPTRSGRAGW